MTQHTTALDKSAGILKIAILAVGGQGGGVLANWIAELANRAGYIAHMTSVAGVAQRTGATIYYLEMAPRHVNANNREPVFALTPAPGDVDIVIAAELMEAGRATLRGFVSADRTTLIASSHRILAVNEKQVPGDGRADSSLVLDEIKAAALRAFVFDMEKLASDAGSMISASLFGALAKSDATPFQHSLFEDVIRESGRGAEASLAAFKAALNYAENATENDDTPGESTPTWSATGPASLLQQWENLIKRVKALPVPVHSIAEAGLRKVVDFQDIDYGSEYLTHLGRFSSQDTTGKNYQLLHQAAKYIANAMCYDDLIRVADLKTRRTRNPRLRDEQEAQPEQIIQVTEYFHPRAQEFCGTLPSVLGNWIEQHPKVFATVDKLVNKGRRIRTDGVLGFGLLWLVGSLKPVRRKLLRHRYEQAHLDRLIQASLNAVSTSYELAVEILQCQRVIKGYSDTHVRGLSKFGQIMESTNDLHSRQDAAELVKRMREAALADESGEMLNKIRNNI